MGRRPRIAVAGWLAAALVASGAVASALAVAGAAPFGGGQTLSASAARAELRTLGPLPTPSPSASAPVPPGGAGVVTAAGTARFVCVHEEPRVEYVSPAPGYAYQIDSIVPAPSLVLVLTGPKLKIPVTATCDGGQARVTVG
jgi:hypothetical protein